MGVWNAHWSTLGGTKSCYIRLEKDVTRTGSSSTRDGGGRGGALEASTDVTSTYCWVVDRMNLDVIMNNKSDNRYVLGGDWNFKKIDQWYRSLMEK